MLPLTVLRRFDCVLEKTKAQVVAAYQQRGESAPDSYYDNLAGQRFHNHSALSFERLKSDPDNIQIHLKQYIHSFSQNVQDIFNKFDFDKEIEKMHDANILFLIVREFASLDLHPDVVDNMQMGLLFEDLIRRFNEQANETAGDYFTPRDVVHLLVDVLLAPDDHVLQRPGTVIKVLDPTCGTGGMLAEVQRQINGPNGYNVDAHVFVYGQEINPRAYAIAAADQLIKADLTGSHHQAHTSRKHSLESDIKYGDTLMNDQFEGQQFDYFLANPPYGVDWKRQQQFIKNQHEKLGYNGRFGAGMPRVSDGSLLFLQHMLHKMQPYQPDAPPGQQGGSRLAVVFSGSPLFSGGAALQSGVPIIITTLQKFPFVTRHLARANAEAAAPPKPTTRLRKKDAPQIAPTATGALPTKRYAVLVDEAHSSQSGDAATELKGVLAGADLQAEARRRAEEEGAADLTAVYEQMARRGQQPNLSFFAFTATPKHRTLAVFGRHGLPFDRYPMRQAIEESFILDVLKSYTTYATYFKLLKSSEEDPNLDRRRAARALTRHLRLHPHNIAQKTAIMVEHFHATTRHRIGGQAKAMVITGSRLEAVRYKQQFDAYIREHGYPMKSLVAFSGTVPDDKLPDVSYTEVKMNGGLPEKELPEAFDSGEYQVLLVAEKYQTGFDQPLLHTMFVDRRLSGIQAVQTLSRLNRTHPLKEDTFVLDFVNEREEIRNAFADYYEGATMGEEADPSRLYTLKATADESGIYHPEEVAEFSRVFSQGVSRLHPAAHRTLNALLDPAVDRFRQLLKEHLEEGELWRKNVQAYLNLYTFLSQIIPFQDSDLERLYTFLRYLVLKLPKRPSEPLYSFDEDVRLQYYRLQKISEGAIVLKDYQGHALNGPTETGTRSLVEEPMALSRLIDLMNERFGTEFTDADQLFFDQIVEVALMHEGLIQAAQANPQEKFALVFASMLETLFVERMDQNVDIFSRFVADGKFRKAVSSWMAGEVYDKLQVRQESPAIQVPLVLQQE